MDSNKRLQLLDIGYTVRLACGRCAHSDIAKGTDWGTCKWFTYQHEKHTETKRQLSIHRYGSCIEFTRREDEYLEGFEEFEHV